MYLESSSKNMKGSWIHALHNQLELLHHQYVEVRQSHQHTVLQQTQQQHAESVQWGRVRNMLDAELVSLRRSKGLLSSGPIDQSDRRSIQEFDFKEVKKQLMETTPHLSSLMFTVGQFSEEAAGPHMTVKDIHSLSALCVLAKKDNNQINGFKLLWV